MWIDVALQPQVAHEVDDFSSFKVVASQVDHVWLTRSEILAIAGDRVDDSEWLASLDDMIAYAAAHGWVNDAGEIRAHVEWQPISDQSVSG